MKDKIIHNSFVRYAAVGVCSTALHYALYTALLWCGMGACVSWACAYGVSWLCNFVATSRFTFGVRPNAMRMVGFAVVHVLNCGLQTGLLAAFVLLGVAEWLAPLPVYAVSVPASYIASRYVMVRGLVLVALLCVPCVGRGVTMSLTEAIRLAQEHSFDAKVARLSYMGSYWTYRSYRAELLPAASLTGSLLGYDHSVTTVRNYDDGRIAYVDNNSLSNSLTLSVSQNIAVTGGTVSLQSYLYRLDQFSYDQTTYNSQPLRLRYDQPLRTYNSLKWRSKSEPVAYEKAKRQYVESMQSIAVTVTTLYFTALSAQLDYIQSIATCNERERLYEQASRRHAIGTVSRSDLLQLELSAINARMAVKRHSLSLDNARFSLFTYLQAVQWHDVQLVTPDNLPAMMLDEDDVVHRAMTCSTHPLTQQLSKLESERALAQARSQRGVQMSLHSELGLYRTADRLSDAYRRLQDNEIVGLTVTVPIFDWGMSKGRVRMAKANLDMVRTQVEQKNEEYMQEARRLVREFNLQYEQCSDASRAEEIARERYSITLQRFEAGAVTVTELNTAQQERESARAQLISQLHSFWSGYYGIQRLTLWNYMDNREIVFDFKE